MKFGKELERLIEATMPKWRDEFLDYNTLKNHLKLISQVKQQEEISLGGMVSEEVEFTKLLALEIIKFNAFFTDKEEEFVIRLQELKEKTINADPVSVLRLVRDLVCLHGEMVLLENYSSLNCTGIVKILKKHDRLNSNSTTETLLRLPFIQKILRQPFFRTELLSEMIEECEQRLQSLELFQVEFTDDAPASLNVDVERNTLAALQTIQHLRNGSSTYGPSSLRYDEFEESNSSSTTTHIFP